MAEETLLNLLSNIGVPAAICFYTLFGVNRTLREQDKTLKELTNAISGIAKDIQKIEHLERQVNDINLKIAHMHWRDS